jgi:hypothetical protein
LPADPVVEEPEPDIDELPLPDADPEGLLLLGLPLFAAVLSLIWPLARSKHLDWACGLDEPDDAPGEPDDCAAAYPIPPTSNAVAASRLTLPNISSSCFVDQLATLPTDPQRSRRQESSREGFATAARSAQH